METHYYELHITPKNNYQDYIDLISNLYNEALEEDNGTIILRSEENFENIMEGLDYFNAIQSYHECTINQFYKKNEDWIEKYQNSIKSIECGIFHIHPSWNKPSENKINIKIDPALAFGSGHHESTASCLEAISSYVQKNDTLLDVGTGSGILAIAASKLGANCDICDTDTLAVENALKNFTLNEVRPNNYWDGSINTTTEISYDIVIANIVADVLIFIHQDLKKVLKENGILILSGILEEYRDKVMEKFSTLKLIDEIKKNEWRTLVLQRK